MNTSPDFFALEMKFIIGSHKDSFREQVSPAALAEREKVMQAVVKEGERDKLILRAAHHLPGQQTAFRLTRARGGSFCNLLF